jgi:hypothetical protein
MRSGFSGKAVATPLFFSIPGAGHYVYKYECLLAEDWPRLDGDPSQPCAMRD